MWSGRWRGASGVDNTVEKDVLAGQTGRQRNVERCGAQSCEEGRDWSRLVNDVHDVVGRRMATANVGRRVDDGLHQWRFGARNGATECRARCSN